MAGQPSERERRRRRGHGIMLRVLGRGQEDPVVAILTAQQMRNGVDALIAPFWQQFQPWQENYKSDPIRSPNGRYWQGLGWPLTVPADGEVINPPDVETDAVPTDSPSPIAWRSAVRESTAGMPTKPLFWSSLEATLAATLPPDCLFQMRCDEYLDPLNGAGYTLRLEFVKGGNNHNRTLGVGPETLDRAHDWREVAPL